MYLLLPALLVAGSGGACATASDPALVTGDALVPPRAAAPLPATGTDEVLPDLSAATRLEDLLPLLLARSPRVRAARARLEAAGQRPPQATALADPMAEVRYFTKNGMAPGESFARYEVMLRQDFPFPTVLSIRGDVATKEAEAEAIRYEATVRDAVAELKDVHAERGYLVRAEAVQRAIRDIYRRYAELARGGAESGRTRLPESFRAEALLAQADYELTLVAEVRAVEDQRLRSLLALPRSFAIGAPADAAPLVPLDIGLDVLARRALERNQELRAAGVEVDVAQLGRRLARWDYAPMFSVGAGRMVNDDFDVATGRTRDSATVTFGMTLPIWTGAKNAAVREAEARERAARAAESGERERVVADVARLAFRVRNAYRLAELYGRELVPQAEKALLRSQSMMREGKESMSSGLELAATWQQLRIAELRAYADAAQSVAALERVLGASLVAVPAAGAEEAPR